MLRFDHLPSDFHPLFLFLGDSPDLGELAAVLRAFSEQPVRTDVRGALPGAGGSSQLSLVPAEGPDAPYGIRPADRENHYTWTLNAWQAGQVAQRVQALTLPALKSGNDIIELGIEGEIPVKVSRGEFTENFLTPRHHLHPDYRPGTSGAQ